MYSDSLGLANDNSIYSGLPKEWKDRARDYRDQRESQSEPYSHPYDPSYSPSPKNCAHYPPGSLRDICQGTPDKPDMNCARKCLKDYWPGNYNGPSQDYAFWLIPQHPVCWYECNITPDDFCEK